MHHSSESIGKIAAALALAQRQLENPEKSLTAIIPSPFPREGTTSFRYASLASGLEIIRKALSEQEIAAIQRTEIDKELGLIRLNTVLAHSSGEWIASDWPVCATGEVGAPHRLGAALTYARRYALFALVGITGEDDLDLPDLPSGAGSQPVPSVANGLEHSGRPRQRAKLYAVAASQETKSKLLKELDGVNASEDLMLWALRRLPLKNRLQDGDAGEVEAAYVAKLQGLGEVVMSSEVLASAIADDGSPASVVHLPKTSRLRDKRHLAFVAAQPCLVCRRAPSDAHHLKFAQPRALGRKVSDQFTVPLCRAHHEELHRTGNELSWWANIGISPLDHAQELWRTTHDAQAVPEQRRASCTFRKLRFSRAMLKGRAPDLPFEVGGDAMQINDGE